MKTAKNSTTETSIIKEVKSKKTYFGPALLSKSRNRSIVAAELTIGHILENKKYDKYIVTTADEHSIILTVLDQKGNQTNETRRYSRISLAGLIVNNHFANTAIARRETFSDIAGAIESNRLLK